MKLFKQLEKNAINMVVMAIAFAVALFTKFNVIFVIIAGAVFGILLNCVFKKKSLPVENISESTKGDE